MTATATAPVTNGRAPRKQLSDQLDRLDTIIDALAEGLPGAVADSCKEGARAAVKDAIVAALTSPELRALLESLRAAPAPAPACAPGLWARLKAAAAAARGKVTGAVTRVREVLTSRFRAADAVSALGALTGEPLRWRRVLWIGAAVGATAGLACLASPHAVAAAVGALGAAATGVAAQVGGWLSRAARRFGLA